MNKKIKALGILLLLTLIFFPIHNASAWAYLPRVVKYNSFTSAQAGTYNINDSKTYYFGNNLYIHEAHEGNITYHGYCLHANKSVKIGGNLQRYEGFSELKSDKTNASLTESQQELLKNILASGYQNDNHNIEDTIVNYSTNGSIYTTCRSTTVCKEVLATQILVWEVMDYGRTNYNYNPNGIARNTYAYISTDGELKQIYERILDNARDLTDEGNVPDAFGKTFNLTWNDSQNRYESESIYIGDYNIDTNSLQGGISVSDKNEGKIQIYSDKQLNSNNQINFKLIKGTTSDSYLPFQWFRFTNTGKYQDIVLGSYKKVIQKSLYIKTEEGKFKVAKFDKDTAKQLIGAKFNVFKCDSTTSCDWNNVVYSIDLSSSYISNEYRVIKSGIYLFREVAVPNGYEKLSDFLINIVVKDNNTSISLLGDANKYVTVDSNTNNTPVVTLKVLNETKKYSLNKIDGNTKSAIKGAHFKVRDSKGNYLKFKNVNGTFTYDNNGDITELVDLNRSTYTFALLPKGEYIIEEVSVPYPYTLSGTQSERETRIKIDTNYDLMVYNYNQNKYERSSTASVTVSNYKTKVEIIKKGKNNTKLPGVVFELYDKNKINQISLLKTSDGIYQYPENGNGTNIQLITNSEGKITINYLPVGTYYMKEVKTVDGYVIDPTVEWKEIKVEVTRDGQTSPIQLFEWPNSKGEFCFYKIDEDGNYLTDGKFKIQVYNESSSKYEDISLIFNEKENNYTFDATGKSDIYTFSPVANGETCFVDINAKGKYRVVELEAPKGFILPNVSETNADFVVNENGYVIGNTTIINKKVTVGAGADAQAELIINISTGQQRIRYAIIISVLFIVIFGLIILNKKMSKK